MMSGGIGFRAAGIFPDIFVAFFYSGLGCALALAGVVFTRNYFCYKQLIVKAAGTSSSCSLYLVSDGSLWVEKYYYIFVKEKAIENSSIAFWVYIVIHLVIYLYYY